MRNIIIFKILFIGLTCSLKAQDKTDSVSIWQDTPVINISGFMDVFYAYDFNKPDGPRQGFFFNHNRHNELNLNLGLVKINIEHAKYRANFALHTGTYANDNYAEEPGLLKNIFEANVGLSLNEKNNLWIDAGVLPSHIGFESAVSIDNWTLTRSLLAENSPYFLAGAKLTYKPSEKWEIAGLMINGWQRIQRLQGNSMPSVGTQLNYKPSDRTLLNWSTFIGTDDPDMTRRMRYFNNLYGQFQLTERLGLITGFDIGIQQESKASKTYDVWLSPVIIGQFTIDKHWKTSIRAEYYQDQTGIIIPTGTANGFSTSGFSLNLDYFPTSNIACRLEGRYLKSKDNIFDANSTPKDDNFFIAASIAIKFFDTMSK